MHEGANLGRDAGCLASGPQADAEKAREAVREAASRADSSGGAEGEAGAKRGRGLQPGCRDAARAGLPGELQADTVLEDADADAGETVSDAQAAKRARGPRGGRRMTMISDDDSEGCGSGQRAGHWVEAEPMDVEGGADREGSDLENVPGPAKETGGGRQAGGATTACTGVVIGEDERAAKLRLRAAAQRLAQADEAVAAAESALERFRARGGVAGASAPVTARRGRAAARRARERIATYVKNERGDEAVEEAPAEGRRNRTQAPQRRGPAVPAGRTPRACPARPAAAGTAPRATPGAAPTPAAAAAAAGSDTDESVVVISDSSDSEAAAPVPTVSSDSDVELCEPGPSTGRGAATPARCDAASHPERYRHSTQRKPLVSWASCKHMSGCMWMHGEACRDSWRWCGGRGHLAAGRQAPSAQLAPG
jgi:hypothetical protein